MDRYVVVSFHDLAPHSLGVCCEIINDLRDAGIERLSLLVTPKWHDGELTDASPGFMERLRELERAGHEISLHGFTHLSEEIKGGPIAQAMGRIYTASEGEFYQIAYDAAKERVGAGLQMLRAAGLTVRGFTPPAWLLSGKGRRVLAEEGLIYSTELQRVDLLQADRKIYAPTLVFSSRSGWRRWASIRWVRFWERFNRNNPVMRLAIHPIDWRYPAIRETVLQMANRLAESRTPITYLELAQRNGS